MEVSPYCWRLHILWTENSDDSSWIWTENFLRTNFDRTRRSYASCQRAKTITVLWLLLWCLWITTVTIRVGHSLGCHSGIQLSNCNSGQELFNWTQRPLSRREIIFDAGNLINLPRASEIIDLKGEPITVTLLNELISSYILNTHHYPHSVALVPSSKKLLLASDRPLQKTTTLQTVKHHWLLGAQPQWVYQQHSSCTWVSGFITDDGVEIA